MQAAGKLREAATYYHAILRRQPNHSVANNLAQLIWMCVSMLQYWMLLLRRTVPQWCTLSRGCPVPTVGPTEQRAPAVAHSVYIMRLCAFAARHLFI